jgi:hypothetical protein
MDAAAQSAWLTSETLGQQFSFQFRVVTVFCSIHIGKKKSSFFDSCEKGDGTQATRIYQQHLLTVSACI